MAQASNKEVFVIEHVGSEGIFRKKWVVRMANLSRTINFYPTRLRETKEDSLANSFAAATSHHISLNRRDGGKDVLNNFWSPIDEETMSAFMSIIDEPSKIASELVAGGLLIADKARDILLRADTEFFESLLPLEKSDNWKFHMAIITIGSNYGLYQGHLSRENSGKLLNAIREKIRNERRLGPAALNHFDRFMAAWWELKHIPNSLKGVPKFIGTWFLLSLGRNIGPCEEALVQGIGAYMILAHLKK